VFTKTAGYRHDSIPAAIQAIRTLGAQNGFEVDATEDDTAFAAANLSRYAAVAFVLTTGDVLDAVEQAALEAYIRSGGGFVGVHSAADTERDWPWYGRLVGAWSSGHPEIQQATLDVREPRDASTSALPARWTRTDEWYGFLSSPRAAGVRVLLSLDESSYAPGDWAMGADHPIAWSHSFDGGRAWYSAGGHTEAAYSEPLFLGHLLGGIRFAIGEQGAVPTTPTPLTRPVIRLLSVTVRNRRVAVSLRVAGCARCSATMRIGGKTTRLRSRAGALVGTSRPLAPQHWTLTVVATDRSTGLERRATRRVQVGSPSPPT
jgi:type 1 glutamine amidotransferase